MTTPTYTGFLYRTPDGVAAEIADTWGSVIRLVGVPGERDGVRGYALVSDGVEIGAGLELPGDGV